MSEQNSLVKMHNNLAEARYQLSPIEQKIFIYAIRQIDHTKKEFNEVDLVISELAEIADINEKNLLKKSKLDRYIKNIMRTVIETWDVNEKGKTRLRMYNLTQNAKHVEGEAIIKFKFNKDMMPLLLDLQKNFFIQAPEVIKFSSTHSMRMYDFFKAKYNEIEWNTTIEKFKKQFGLEAKYKTWQDLKKRVIEPAIEEINETDLTLTYKMRKRGRGAYYLDFRFERKADAKSNEYEEMATTYDIASIKKDSGLHFESFTDGQVLELYDIAFKMVGNNGAKPHSYLRDCHTYMLEQELKITDRFKWLRKAVETGCWGNVSPYQVHMEEFE